MLEFFFFESLVELSIKTKLVLEFAMGEDF